MVFKSWKIAAVSFLSGVLIDIDHVFDYFWEFRKRLIVKEFFDVHCNNNFSFFSVIFHSWELLFLLNIYAFFISCNHWIIGITLGFTQHLVLDQFFNKPKRWLYFFFWRLKNGFRIKKMLPKL
jgi:hypothetical protein